MIKCSGFVSASFEDPAMTLFKPNIAMVHSIVEASPSFAWEMRVRTLMEHPNEETDIDWEKAKSVLGEQIVGRIAMVARDVACVRPESKILFSDAAGNIDPAWAKSFFAYLHLSPKTKVAAEIRINLIKDLTGWAQKHSQDAQEIGLTLDGKGQLHLLCQRLRPVLDPIPD
jgi:hypothetical protein